MNLYVIGKLKPNKRVLAYKIYDSDSKESKLIALQDIMNAMGKGVEIHGLHYRIDCKCCGIITLNKNVPNINSIDSVDFSGKPLSTPNSYILTGIEGFEDNRIFHVIDANCQEYKFNITEIKGKTIIGLSQSDNNISIHSKYRKQIY